MHEVPFEPGASPFRCKGLLYLDTLTYFDERFQGGRAALLRHVDDPKLESFLAQYFVIGGWYDVFPLLALNSLAARVTGSAYQEVVRDVARWQVPRQFHGVYRFLLKLTSPDLVMTNLPRLGDKYFDFLRVETRKIREKTYESSGHGIPAVAASTYLTITDVAIRAALELAGAQGIRIHRHPLQPVGEAHGLSIVATKRVVSWG